MSSDNENLKERSIESGIKPEYIVERNGQYFVIYKGLLDLAHNRGFDKRPFIGFVNNVIIKLDLDKKECVHMITARFGNANDHADFTATGHASPDTISSSDYTNFFVTISETRAKARALRDALNIPLTSLEEMGSEPSTPKNGNGNGSKNGNGSSHPISQKQIDLINRILDDNGKTVKILSSAFAQYKVSSLEELSISQADTIIKSLNKKFAPSDDTVEDL